MEKFFGRWPSTYRANSAGYIFFFARSPAEWQHHNIVIGMSVRPFDHQYDCRHADADIKVEAAGAQSLARCSHNHDAQRLSFPVCRITGAAVRNVISNYAVSGGIFGSIRADVCRQGSCESNKPSLEGGLLEDKKTEKTLVMHTWCCCCNGGRNRLLPQKSLASLVPGCPAWFSVTVH